MTDRYVALDIRDKIITLLKDSSTGVNYYIALINGERTHVCPLIETIDYKPIVTQNIFIFVDMGDSETEEEELTSSYTKLTENYEVYINAFVKSFDNSIYDFAEDMAEAIIRCIHGYHDDSITWIKLNKIERAEVYDQQDQIQKIISCNFNVRIN